MKHLLRCAEGIIFMENKLIVLENILESKKNIQRKLRGDYLLIFFTRVLEDLKTNENPDFSGRVKEIFLLIDPYNPEEDLKKIFKIFIEHDFDSEYGIKLSEQEKNFLRIFRDSLDDDVKFKHPKVMKGRINGILKILSNEYFPNSSKIIEPYLIGKLIGFVGGIENFYYRPASTIQIIGAEKALFRHLSEGKLCPKYGLIYKSKFIQQEKNKGRAARKLSNGLAIAIRKDYFQKFYED